MKTILCATDFSANAGDAWRYALGLAAQAQARVVAVYCEEEAPARPAPLLTDSRAPAPPRGADAAARLAALTAGSPGAAGVSGALAHGAAAAEILAAAQRERADLIVLGCTGSGRRQQLLLGRTAGRVLREAACPVVCVPAAGEFRPVRRIILGADSTADNAAPAAALAAFARTLDAEAMLVFLDGPRPEWKTPEFQQKLADVHRHAGYAKLVFRRPQDKRVVFKLENRVKLFPAEMLALAPRGAGFWGGALPAGATQVVAFQHRLPLLALPVPRPAAPWRAALGAWRRRARREEPAPAEMDTNLERFKDAHKWQRCFVVGNGPSLNRMDLAELEGEMVFGTNAIFLLFPRLRWRPQYYACVDTRVLPDRAADIVRMHRRHPEMVCFFPQRLTNHQTREVTLTTRFLPPAPNRVYFHEEKRTPDNLPLTAFSLEPERVIYEPYTVTVSVLQLAYLLGFEPIYLIGCDTQYTIPPTVRQEGKDSPVGRMFYTSTANDDPNHFAPDYFGKGRQWHNPQVENMIWHYTMAREALALAGRHVYNATLGGRLEVFPRVNYDDLF